MLASFYDDGTSVTIYKCKENAVKFSDCMPDDQYISIDSKEFYKIWNASYEQGTPLSFEKAIEHYSTIIERLEFDVTHRLVDNAENARKTIQSWRKTQTEIVENFRIFTTEILEPLKDKQKFTVYSNKSNLQNKIVEQIFAVFLPRNLKTAEAKKALSAFQSKYDQYEKSENVILEEIKAQTEQRDNLEENITSASEETKVLRLEYVKTKCAFQTNQSEDCQKLKIAFLEKSKKETDLRVQYQDAHSLVVTLTKKLNDFQSTKPEKPLAPLLGFGYDYENRSQPGIIVQSVVPGSLANKSGIVVGDKITRIGGYLIAQNQKLVENSVNMDDIRSHIYGRDSVVVTVNNQGRILKFTK